MKLYLVHCGFYDPEVSDGLYESHTNFFVAADSFEEAREKIKHNKIFQNKKCHIDGLQEVQSIDGFWVHLEYDTALENKSLIVNFKHRDLAPKLPLKID